MMQKNPKAFKNGKLGNAGRYFGICLLFLQLFLQLNKSKGVVPAVSRRALSTAGVGYP